jgi:hypothetical protein
LFIIELGLGASLTWCPRVDAKIDSIVPPSDRTIGIGLRTLAAFFYETPFSLLGVVPVREKLILIEVSAASTVVVN